MPSDDHAAPAGTAQLSPYRAGEPFGAYLIRMGYLTPDALDAVLAIQRQSGGRVGWIAHQAGYLSRRAFLEALAGYYGLPFWDLVPPNHVSRIDPEVTGRVTAADVLRRETMPVRWVAPGVLECWTLNPQSEPVRRWLDAVFHPTDVLWIVLSELAWREVVQQVWGLSLTATAIEQLAATRPLESAKRVVTRGQAWVLGLIAGGWLFLAGWHPVEVARWTLVAWSLFFAGFWGAKVLWALVGWHDRPSATTAKEAPNEATEWPVYTILVPLYREPPSVVADLISSLAQLQYPAHKLDVLFLLEEYDAETISAVKAARPPWNIRLVIIKDSLPRTKPKACNYGLQYARGEYLVIYDAEDRPDPDQLIKALAAFRDARRPVVLQAALNFYNATQNWLTRCFTLEYALWFDGMLPGLAKLGWPLPLGGTSNHFATTTLRELQGWDPYNVTEDADLGLRAAAHQTPLMTLASTTWEEATSRLGNWVHQRARWIKGYMQTTLVYTRQPIRHVRNMGLVSYLASLWLVGGTAVSLLLAPLAWLVALAIAVDPGWVGAGWAMRWSPVWWTALAVGYGLLLAGHGWAGWRRGYRWAWAAVWLMPGYWMLASVAAWMAFAEMWTHPSFWYRTVHGHANTPSAPVAG